MTPGGNDGSPGEVDPGIIQVLPEPTLLLTGQGVILEGNPAAAAVLGVPRASLAGRPLAELLDGDAAEVVRYLRTCARSRQPVIGTLPPIRGTTERPRASGAVVLPRTADREAVVLLRLDVRQESAKRFLTLTQRIGALNQEIARRRQAEATLADQRQWLEITLTSIGDAVITTDDEARITLLNPLAERLTGWTRAEAVGKPLHQVFVIVNQASRQPVPSPVVRVLAEGVMVGLAENTVLLGRHGTEVEIEDTAAPIRDGRELRGVVLVFRDVGARRSMERELMARAERLAEADRRKDEFLAMLAHELRNPLAPIRTGVEAIRASPALAGRVVDIIDRQVSHLTRMVDDLLEVSRIVHGRIRLQRERVDLGALVADAATDHLARARRAEIDLHLEELDRGVWVDGDPARLVQIVANLLDNSVKFTPPGGSITLRVRATEGSEAELTVSDTGVGIEAEVLGRVFEPFAQADRTLDRSSGGLGLGLAMVHGLIQLHGGQVEVASDGPGRGTTVRARLPLAGAAPAGAC